MSAPAQLKLMPPCFVDPRYRSHFMFIYIIQIWISLIPTVIFIYLCFAPYDYPFSLQSLIVNNGWTIPPWVILILIPFILCLMYLITMYWSAVVTKIRLKWLSWLCPPREGIFKRELKDKDYRYWNKRNIARLFLFWLVYNLPFALGKEYFTFRFFGIKIGKDCIITDCWISPEFIQIGNNVHVSQGAAVYSYLFEADRLLIAKVILEDNVIICPRSTVFPGCHLKEGTILNQNSYLLPFQTTDPNYIYFGLPAKKFREKKPEEF